MIIAYSITPYSNRIDQLTRAVAIHTMVNRDIFTRKTEKLILYHSMWT